jgi:hypothetical protein
MSPIALLEMRLTRYKHRQIMDYDITTGSPIMFINITKFYYFSSHLKCHTLPTTTFFVEPPLLVERFLISHDS